MLAFGNEGSEVMRFPLGSALVSIGVSLCANAHASDKSAQICNTTGQTLFVALGYLDDLFPQSIGWLIVNDQTCKRYDIPEADMLPPIYAYAKTADGSEFAPSGPALNFCIKRREAFQLSSAMCTAADAVLQGTTGNNAVTLMTWQTFHAMPIADSFQSHTWTVRAP